MNDCLIAVAPNGARKTHADHPRLPVTADEIAKVARGCADAGAALLHLHVRDSNGGHTLDPVRYGEAIDAVRSVAGSDLVIQITTEAVGRYTAAEQMAAVEQVRPEACSIALREMIGGGDAPGEDRYVRFLADCRASGVWVQHILYDREDVETFSRLWNDARIEERPSVLLVVGRKSVTGQADPFDLLTMLMQFGVSSLPRVDWSVCGFGVNETRILATAAALGGHIRVGFENSHLRPDGTIATSNEERVTECARMIRSLGRNLMEPSTLRERIASAL